MLRAADDRVVVALGDVSGKGIPAALFMAVAVTVLRTLARQFPDPAEIVRRLSDELADQNPRGMFVTIQCLAFDFARGPRDGGRRRSPSARHPVTPDSRHAWPFPRPACLPG